MYTLGLLVYGALLAALQSSDVLASEAKSVISDEDVTYCSEGSCVNGYCRNNTCVCHNGWTGTFCEYCSGKVRLTSTSGYISDGAGNYTLDTKCSWLIDSGTSNSTVRLDLGQLATECSWDHLFVYDGDSVYSPLIAVFSGLLKAAPSPGSVIKRIITHSGRVFLYFFSDAAYNMSGFNVSYAIGTCPDDCSGHGRCVGGTCHCDATWTGVACDSNLCPRNCSQPDGGECDVSAGRCVCWSGYHGEDCSNTLAEGAWDCLHPGHSAGRASHVSVVHGNYMWIIGGESFGDLKTQHLAKFSFLDHEWEVVDPVSVPSNNPRMRYGHSVVVNANKFYMFGGLVLGKNVTNELWMYDVMHNTWTSLQTTALAVVGHTAHYIGDTMYVIFGHSAVYGYTNIVQECTVSGGNCTTATTNGAIVKGSYGHTSVYDGRCIYVHGGYQSTNSKSNHLTDILYQYDPVRRYWRFLHSSGRFRYLHSAAILGDWMLVFGGNTHNDTSMSFGAKCYSTDFLAYDTSCDRWIDLTAPRLNGQVARFGHTAVVHDGRMYVYGGFNGVMLNDVLAFTPGACDLYSEEKSCLKSSHTTGTECVWVSGVGCHGYTNATEAYPSAKITQPKCTTGSGNAANHCYDAYYNTTCPSCTESNYGCVWCMDRCEAASKCHSKLAIAHSHACPAVFSHRCTVLHNCNACHLNATCEWMKSECKYVGGSTEPAPTELGPRVSQCSPPCHQHASCAACTVSSCMWCSNENRCLESNAYVVSFPYGQCMDWVQSAGSCPASNCSQINACDGCQLNPQCGWCGDGSDTGLGRCLQGGNRGAMTRLTDGSYVFDKKQCDAARWYFAECPACQCNGHSQCIENTTVCAACGDLTEGDQCQTCLDGHWGDARNGGNCSQCACNGHADVCDKASGKCFCETKGITGEHCDKCDVNNRYFGNPVGGGTCYYDLATDYQFTFNLSKDDDKYYHRINFKSSPTSSDKDLEFLITCSSDASFNITYTTRNFRHERPIVASTVCNRLKKIFSHKQYSFSAESNTTFYVYVYNFERPIVIKISFSQFPEIDLITFFITFFSCFSSLLVIAVVIWKIKIRYVLYLSRQRILVQMQQMASRPFSRISLDIDQQGDETTFDRQASVEKEQTVKKRHKSAVSRPARPSPISVEPLSGQKTAVLSLFIQLPAGDSDNTPPGQSGLAVASALVAIATRHHRTNSTAENNASKSDTKVKLKGHVSPHNADTCI